MLVGPFVCPNYYTTTNTDGLGKNIDDAAARGERVCVCAISDFVCGKSERDET